MAENRNVHLVQKFKFDVFVEDQKESKQILSSANQLVNQKIIPISEKLLDEWADENTNIQLSRLEIDLGTTTPEQFVSYLPDVIEEKIRASLAGLFSHTPTKQEFLIEKVSAKTALLEQFIHFLQEGWLTWQYQHETMDDPDEILLKLLKSDKSALKDRLLPILDKKQVIDRMIRALESDTMDLLLAELAFPDAATQALLLIGELVHFNHVQAWGLSRKQIELAVYRHAFSMVAHQQIVFSGASISRIFYELLALLNLETQKQSSSVSQFGDFVKNEKFLSQFTSILDELKHANGQDMDDPETRDSNTNSEDQKNQLDKGLHPLKKRIICNLNNAGLILIYPYLKTMFEGFGWVKTNHFVNEECRSKAILMTDYLVYNDREIISEHDLVLNKILCGMELREALDPLVFLSTEEKGEARGLLEAAVGHWSTLKNTSIEGYQLSFLRRDGVLEYGESCWRLKVERKSFDLLLETLPYTISIIRLPWMNEKLIIEW